MCVLLGKVPFFWGGGGGVLLSMTNVFWGERGREVIALCTPYTSTSLFASDKRI